MMKGLSPMFQSFEVTTRPENGPPRLAALRALEEFTERIDGLGYLQRDGHEEIAGDVAADRDRREVADRAATAERSTRAGRHASTSPTIWVGSMGPDGFAVLPIAGQAQFTDPFGLINPAWVTNRYEPAGFTSVLFGGDQRLQLTIDQTGGTAARAPEFSSPFYNTQGRQRPGPMTELVLHLRAQFSKRPIPSLRHKERVVTKASSARGLSQQSTFTHSVEIAGAGRHGRGIQASQHRSEGQGATEAGGPAFRNDPVHQEQEFGIVFRIGRVAGAT